MPITPVSNAPNVIKQTANTASIQVTPQFGGLTPQFNNTLFGNVSGATSNPGVLTPAQAAAILARPLSSVYAEITAHAGGGQSSATKIDSTNTLVKTAASDHDSVRFQGTADVAVTAGMTGRIENGSSSIVDLYPPSGKRIYDSGVDQGVDAQIELQPGDVIFWCIDSSGNYRL